MNGLGRVGLPRLKPLLGEVTENVNVAAGALGGVYLVNAALAFPVLGPAEARVGVGPWLVDKLIPTLGQKGAASVVPLAKLALGVILPPMLPLRGKFLNGMIDLAKVKTGLAVGLTLSGAIGLLAAVWPDFPVTFSGFSQVEDVPLLAGGDMHGAALEVEPASAFGGAQLEIEAPFKFGNIGGIPAGISSVFNSVS